MTCEADKDVTFTLIDYTLNHDTDSNLSNLLHLILTATYCITSDFIFFGYNHQVYLPGVLSRSLPDMSLWLILWGSTDGSQNQSTWKLPTLYLGKCCSYSFL